jgi:hypothetical protein
MKILFMGNILYFIAFLLMAIWAVAYVGFKQGGVTHTLIILAIIAVLIKLIHERNSDRV